MRLIACILCSVALASCSGFGGSAPAVVPAGVSNDSALAASGVTYETIFRFNGADGANPDAELTDYGGTLYGTTAAGGHSGAGTFFQITPSGTEETLYKFGVRRGDGINPEFGPLVEIGGVFYGTTYSGGKYNMGTVFQITPAGAESVIYSFKGGTSDGANPEAGLTVVNGTLYGTTSAGGFAHYGTVFSVTVSGSESLLHSFEGGPDGAAPEGGLTYLKGKLYGTTSAQGAYFSGTVFSIALSGGENPICQFELQGGAGPTGTMVALNGVLYGTTQNGGTVGTGSGTSGTVFRVTTSGAEKAIHSFGASSDGANPYFSNLVYIKGAFYGTTSDGGAKGDGTVFKVTPSGKESVLYSFKGGTDGEQPRAGLVSIKGTLYGVASEGGDAANDGTIFSITP